MAKAKAKVASKKQRDPLPEHFNSIEEAGEFWDTHDSGDYEDYMHDVECEFEINRSVYRVSLDSDLYHKVTAIAQTRGVKEP
ncbi:MAG: CopG family antitoxin [Blastocatellia bacterium]